MEKGTAKAINNERRIQLRRDDDYIHIMKYMGSKRELLPDIKSQVAKTIRPGDTVLDIFAGTCSVGCYLRREYNIYSNDIQAYSQILADALIGSRQDRKVRAFDTLTVQLSKAQFKNAEMLRDSLAKTLRASDAFTSKDLDGWSQSDLKDYLSFFESFPSPLNEFKTVNKELKKLTENYFERSQASDAEARPGDFFQTTFLFAETYFSLRQCIDLDSIRFAIDEVCESKYERAIALAALIHAHSYCSSGTGHFAMFRDLATLASVRDVFIYRKRNVWDYFVKKLAELLAFREFAPNQKHKSFTLNFEEILSNKGIMAEVDVIYADPPYSFVHYSRFYHATESLVRYDYMVPEHKGRYRTDRHQSPFCQQKNVKAAFQSLYSSAALHAKPVILSYSDTGMIGLKEIVQISDELDFATEVQVVDYNHSTMGRKGHKSNLIKEYLVVSKPKTT